MTRQLFLKHILGLSNTDGAEARYPDGVCAATCHAAGVVFGGVLAYDGPEEQGRDSDHARFCIWLVVPLLGAVLYGIDKLTENEIAAWVDT